MYVTSLSFEQGSEFDEGMNSSDMSQYSLEDILDEYLVAVNVFYSEQNDGSSNVCILEFFSLDISDIENLLGRHTLYDVFVRLGTYRAIRELFCKGIKF